MASLQDRIRNAARDEVALALGQEPTDTAAPSRAQLQQQITDLHEHLHQAATTIRRLEERVEALEKAAAAAGEETSTQRRTTRKRAEP